MQFLKIATICALLFALLASTSAHAADATLTFTDNANNEDGFRVERNLNGGTYTLLPSGTLAPNITSLLDTTLVQSTTTANKYCYRVLAFNSAGNSAFATTATPGVTDCKTVPMLITIPAGPTGLLVQ